MSCCESPYNFGCYNHCGSISTGVDSDFTGTLTGHFSYAGITVSRDIDVESGEEIVIPLNGLNETALYTLTLYDESGVVYPLTISGTEYTCFKFKTQVIYNSVADAVTPAEDCCESVTLTMTGVSSRTILVTEWSQFGAIPSIEVIVKVGGVYQSVPTNWTPDTMPNPTQIVVDLGSIPADPWYIRLK